MASLFYWHLCRWASNPKPQFERHLREPTRLLFDWTPQKRLAFGFQSEGEFDFETTFFDPLESKVNVGHLGRIESLADSSMRAMPHKPVGSGNSTVNGSNYGWRLRVWCPKRFDESGMH